MRARQGRAAVLRSGLGFVLVACAPSTPPAATPAAYGALRGEALGTTWSVRWSPVEALSAGAARGRIDEALSTVDQAMSTWRDDSELMAVRYADGPVRVSPETAEVVEAALSLAAASGGAFDPTVQPLMELWGLHGEPRATWPTEAEIESARAQVDWTRVRVDVSDGGPTVDGGGTALDLSAIAKGHAVDRVFASLAAGGALDLLVEVGGEVRVAGRSPRGGPWAVGVDRPVVGRAPGQDLVARVVGSNHAVATSGNYRNALEIEGRRVHHTMDPRTGRPAVSPARSVTVVAPDARTADGWATALMVLGVDGLAEVEARPGLEAWVLVDDREGKLRASSSAGMAALLDGVALEGRASAD